MCALLLIGPCLAEAGSELEQMYSEAALLMVSGCLEEAAARFEALLGYSDAPQMAIYCKALAAAGDSEYELAIAAFEMLGDFKDSRFCARYYDARREQALGDAQHDTDAYLKAAELYDGLLLFRDARERSAQCAVSRADALLHRAYRVAGIAGGYCLMYNDEGWYYVDPSGERLNKEPYREAQSFANGLAAVGRSDGRVIYIDDRGEAAFEGEWDYGQSFTSYGLAIVGKGGYFNRLFGVINREGQQVAPAEYSNIRMSASGVTVQQNGKWGAYSTSGERLAPCEFDSVSIDYSGVCWVTQNGKRGVYANGALQVPCVADDVYSGVSGLWDGVWKVKIDGKTGLYSQGQCVLDCAWDNLSVILPGFLLAATRSGEEPQYFLQEQAEEGALFVPSDIVRTQIIDNGSCFAKTKEGWTLLKPGEDAKPLPFDDVKSARYGLYRAQQNGLWGLVDAGGEWIASCAYDEIGSFTVPGLAFVRQGEKYGYMDKAGTLVIPCAFDYAGEFYDGFAPAVRDGVCGAINTRGEWHFTLDAPVENVWREPGGFRIRRGEKWGFVSLEGKELLKCEWDDVEVSPYGFLAVQSGEKYGLFDARGGVLLPCECEQFYALYTGREASEGEVSFLGVCRKGKWGVYSLKDQKWLLPCEYDSATQYSRSSGYSYPGYVLLLNAEGRVGLYDLAGEEMLLPCQYDDVAGILSADETSCAVLIRDRKSGLYDLKEKRFVLDCEYETLRPAGKKLLVTGKSGEDGSLYGLCGLDGREILPCVCQSIQTSENCIAALENNYLMLLNEDGERTF